MCPTSPESLGVCSENIQLVERGEMGWGGGMCNVVKNTQLHLTLQGITSAGPSLQVFGMLQPSIKPSDAIHALPICAVGRSCSKN